MKKIIVFVILATAMFSFSCNKVNNNDIVDNNNGVVFENVKWVPVAQPKDGDINRIVGNLFVNAYNDAQYLLEFNREIGNNRVMACDKATGSYKSWTSYQVFYVTCDGNASNCWHEYQKQADGTTKHLIIRCLD